MKKWILEFPNVRFGLTALVAKFGPQDIYALRWLDLKCLLLETDSLYFRMIGIVGGLVAEKIRQPWREILRASAENTQDVVLGLGEKRRTQSKEGCGLGRTAEPQRQQWMVGG